MSTLSTAGNPVKTKGCVLKREGPARLLLLVTQEEMWPEVVGVTPGTVPGMKVPLRRAKGR